MNDKYTVLNENLSFISINGVPLDLNVFSIEVSSTSEFFVSAHFVDGKILSGLVKNYKSCSENLQVVKIAPSSYALIFSSPRAFEDKVFSQTEVSLKNKTHQITHIKNTNQNFTKIIIECEDSFFSIQKQDSDFEKALTFGGKIFVFLKHFYYILDYSKDYKVDFEGEKSFFEQSLNSIKIVHLPHTNEGYEITSTFSFLQNTLSKTCDISFLRKNNFTQKTLALTFFERLKYCDDSLVLELLNDDFSLSDIPLLRKFIGDFDYCAPVSQQIVALFSQNTIKCFKVTTCGNLVGNIKEG